MVRPDTPPSGIEGLVAAVLPSGIDDRLTAELGSWVAGSGRFRLFVETYRDKIRKKLRGAGDPESRRDVRAELAVARLLLADRAVSLEFEPYGSQRLGPDFALTIGSSRLNLEVTRMRRPPTEPAIGATVLGKLRQLPPSAANMLLLAVDGVAAGSDEIAAAIRWLRERADAKDETFFTERGFAGTRAFYDRFLRLGAIIAWSEGASGEARAASWTNGSARIAVPPRSLRRVLHQLRDGA